MKGKFFYLFFLGLFFVHCSDSETKEPEPNPKPISGLQKLEDALTNGNMELHQLINRTRGRVGVIGAGSKVVWSRKNKDSLGLYISVNHVIGIDFWESRNEGHIDIANINNGIFVSSHMPLENGDLSFGSFQIADFKLYHPTISDSVTNTTIVPAEDFYLGVLDGQRKTNDGFGTYPELVGYKSPLGIYDPEKNTLQGESWGSVQTAEQVFGLGYPQDVINYPNGAFSEGEVLSDEEAKEVILGLMEEGDIEGTIAYNPEVEFFATLEAIAGMSGGGVFNKEGQLVGIMVRATTLNDISIVRVIRLDYIHQKITAYYHSLSENQRLQLKPYLGSEVGLD